MSLSYIKVSGGFSFLCFSNTQRIYGLRNLQSGCFSSPLFCHSCPRYTPYFQPYQTLSVKNVLLFLLALSPSVDRNDSAFQCRLGYLGERSRTPHPHSRDGGPSSVVPCQSDKLYCLFTCHLLHAFYLCILKT